MAPVSKDDLCMSFATGTLQGAGETPVTLCRGAGVTRDIPVDGAPMVPTVLGRFRSAEDAFRIISLDT